MRINELFSFYSKKLRWTNIQYTHGFSAHKTKSKTSSLDYPFWWITFIILFWNSYFRARDPPEQSRGRGQRHERPGRAGLPDVFSSQPNTCGHQPGQVTTITLCTDIASVDTKRQTIMQLILPRSMHCILIVHIFFTMTDISYKLTEIRDLSHFKLVLIFNNKPSG